MTGLNAEEYRRDCQIKQRAAQHRLTMAIILLLTLGVIVALGILEERICRHIGLQIMRQIL